MKCPNCSKKIPKDSKFCEYCGNKIDSEAVTDKNVKKIKPPVNDIYNKAIDHLEFLGYQIESRDYNDNWYTCLGIHSSKSNIFLRFNPTIGFTLVATFTLDKNKILKKKQEFFERVNRMNNTSVLTCFALNNDESAISCFAWYPPTYSKSQFGDFIERYETDIKGRFSSENIADFG